MKDAEAAALLAEHESLLWAAVEKMRPLVAQIEEGEPGCNSSQELRIALNCGAVAFSALLTILVGKGILSFEEFMKEHEWAMGKELQDLNEDTVAP